VKPAFSDAIAAFPQNIKIRKWHNDLASLLQLHQVKFDLVIDLHNKPNTTFIRLFCRADKIVVYNKKHSLRRRIVAHSSSESINSTLDLYFSALYKLRLKPEYTFPQLRSDNNNSGILKHYNLQKYNYIVVFPGATSFTKRWLAEDFAVLIDQISPLFPVVIGGSPGETELCRKLQEICQNEVKNLCGKTTIPQLIEILSQAKAVITNDSGPAHLTAALGAPLVTIFGGTSPRLGFAPLGDKVRIISQNLDCSPCSLHGLDKCPAGHFNCMKQVTVISVFNILMELIGKK
jgi:lipopolysaccharide heptosyltransferase II